MRDIKPLEFERRDFVVVFIVVFVVVVIRALWRIIFG